MTNAVLPLILSKMLLTLLNGYETGTRKRLRHSSSGNEARSCERLRLPFVGYDARFGHGLWLRNHLTLDETGFLTVAFSNDLL